MHPDSPLIEVAGYTLVAANLCLVRRNGEFPSLVTVFPIGVGGSPTPLRTLELAGPAVDELWPGLGRRRDVIVAGPLAIFYRRIALIEPFVERRDFAAGDPYADFLQVGFAGGCVVSVPIDDAAEFLGEFRRRMMPGWDDIPDRQHVLNWEEEQAKLLEEQEYVASRMAHIAGGN